MVKNITAGIIGCNMTEEFFKNSVHNQIEKFHWKKILAINKVITNIDKAYPETEVVHNVQAIVNDRDISLVFISENHLDMVPGILEAGKAVRVI